MNDINNPLVSICVITYNSSAYVLDTLNSAKEQTYPNLELIVSDDCSTDDTVEVCRKWMEENSNRFVRTEFVTVEKNTGIPANCNRAINASQGEWIKLIAGDDILLPDCIDKFVKYVTENKKVRIVFSKVQSFVLKKDRMQYGGILPSKEQIRLFDLSSDEQFKHLIVANFVPAATCFSSTELFKGYPYNEQYKYMEDIPQWIRLTHDGIKLHFMDEVTILYRRTENTLSANSTQFYPSLMTHTAISYFYSERLYYLKENNEKAYRRYMKSFLLYHLTEVLFHNKKTKINVWMYRMLCLLLFHRL